MSDDPEKYEEVVQDLIRARLKDFHFREGRVLSSMCTAPHPIAQEAHNMFLEANLGNPGLYPGTLEIEGKLIDMVAEMLNGKNVSGLAMGGGTEANITALWIAKKVTGRSQVVYPASAHHSFLKAADILGLEARQVSLDEEFRMDISEVESAISKDTACVVGIAGTTEFGAVDPISEIGELCSDTFLHVDAAFGGFVIPFLKDLGYDMPEFDFTLESVDCISTDPHKMGMATIPSGVLLLKSPDYLNNIAVSCPYLTSPRQASLSGTRCSAGAVSAYAVMKYLGREGYKNVVSECMENTNYLVKRIKRLGLDLAMEPKMNIVCFHLKAADSVCSELSKLNWKVSVTRKPKCLRIVVMPHVTTKVIDEFMPDLESVLKNLKEI